MKIYTHPEIKKKIKKLPKLKNVKKDFTWHYLYIFHFIKTYKIYNSKFKEDELVPINIKKLRTIISYDFAPKLLKNLLDNKLLESDFCYKVGEKSKCYKIYKEFPEKSWELEEVEDVALNSKLTDLFFSEKIMLINDNSPYSTVTKNLQKLVIDKEKSLEYVKNNIADEGRRNSYEMAIRMFDTKFSVKDDVCNRLHNNLTNMPSVLRQFITCEGKSIYQVDIKCSQPTFLGLHMLKNGIGDKEEVLRYLDSCKKGTLYEEIIKNSEIHDRKALKQLLFKNCFFNRCYKKLNSIEIEFKKTYPTVFEYIQILKSSDFRNLSIILQKEESFFIFNTVSQINFDVLTIHDSIVATEENIYQVKEILENNFLKIYNFKPILTIEKC